MTFEEAITQLVESAHGNAIRNGFADPDPSKRRQPLHMLMEIVNELAECGQAHKTDPDAPDKHCPEFKNAEIELADAVIRIGDMCGEYGYRLGGALSAKMAYNLTRPYKHGKRF